MRTDIHDSKAHWDNVVVMNVADDTYCYLSSIAGSLLEVLIANRVIFWACKDPGDLFELSLTQAALPLFDTPLVLGVLLCSSSLTIYGTYPLSLSLFFSTFISLEVSSRFGLTYNF